MKIFQFILYLYAFMIFHFKHIINKLSYTRQHNKCLLEYIGYILVFRPVNRSSSGLQQSKSQVLF